MVQSIRRGIRIGLVIACMLGNLHGQIGGRSVFDYLRLVPSARIAALGGTNLTTMDRDPNFAWYNPALLNDTMHNMLTTNYVGYLSDINYGYVSYARTLSGIGFMHTGLHYVNYGNFQETDEYGNTYGRFTAHDMVWVNGIARDFGNFRFGSNLKLLYSNIQQFNSFGLALDFGGSWQLPEKNLNAGLVLRNMGSQIIKYQKNAPSSPLPFEIQAGISHRLKYLPLRFSVTLIQLQKFRLIQQDPNKKPEFDLAGNPIPEKKRTFDNILRHFVFGGEFLFSKNFHLRVGYNHLRHQELKSAGKNFSMAGWSFGVGMRIKRFYLDYAYANYHAVGGTHSLGISTYLKKNDYAE